MQKATHTFGMLHLVFKGDRAPPLPGQVAWMVMMEMRGAVRGEVVQQHHICACSDKEKGKHSSVTNVAENTPLCRTQLGFIH